MINRVSVSIILELCMVTCISIVWAQESPQQTNVKKPSSPRVCPTILIDANDPEGTAVRCAEAFLKENGYTAKPPNITRLASESIERVTSVEQLLDWRRNSINLPAIGVCRKGTLLDDWTVVFEGMRPGDPLSGPAVTMNADYSGLRKEHMEFDIEFISDPTSGCKDLRKKSE
jgi:hypothetical protein